MEYSSTPNLAYTNVPQGEWKRFLAIFVVTTVVVLGILRIFFAPTTAVKQDQTDGVVRRSQCQLMAGQITALPSGHSGCKVETVTFSLVD